MLEFTRLKRNHKNDFSGLKSIKVALLCDSSSQLLNIALRGCGYDKGLDLQIYEADYDQIEQQVFDASSELYEFKPEYVIISLSPYKLRKKFQQADKHYRVKFADDIRDKIAGYTDTLQSLLPGCKIICFNVNELNDSVFGNYANKVKESFVYQVRKLNYLISELSAGAANLYVNDIQLLQSQVGNEHIIDYKNYISADSIWSIHFLPLLSKNILDIILSTSGYAKKCLIVDLDNTLWGGIIGDDGINGIEIGDLGLGKAYTELQRWIKELKNRGIIVCVCSKNEESTAKEPFEKHPEMVLRLDDIAVFAANWETKVDNIHYIKGILEIGYDSMVFLDDNPFERNMVKSAIPEIVVPDLPDDASEYLKYLTQLNLFETNSFTDEDVKRTVLYQEEAQRSQLQKVYKNEDEFLEKLNMVAEVMALNDYNIPRSAQLSQRSNQFNLRTVRYSEQDMKIISESPDYFSLVVSLKDNYGDNGIISLIVLKKQNNELFIETWLMSCRVLKRGVEKLVLNCIIERARKENCDTISGEYIPTAKNQMVKDHYAKLGFEATGDNSWSLNVEKAQLTDSFIKIV